MTDVKYTTVPVSEFNEKIALNPQPEEQPEGQLEYPRCPFHRFQRWRGDGEPKRSRWTIVRRVLLTLILFYFIRKALYAGFAQLRRHCGATFSPEELIYSPDPYFEDPERYGANPSPIAQELFEEFRYVFPTSESVLDLDDYLPRSQALEFPDDPFSYHPQEPNFPLTEDGKPPYYLLKVGDISPYYQSEVIDFILSGDLRPPGRRHPPRCNDTKLLPWDGDTKFAFSPEDFQDLTVLLHGSAWPPASVHIRQLDSKDLTNKISIKVSALISNKKFNHLVTASAFDHNGDYVVEINKPKHHGPRDCIKIKINITFPAGLSSFGSLKLRLSGAIVKVHDLDGIYFDSFSFGAGRGALLSWKINADNFYLGAAKGFIHGRFDVASNFTVNTLSGFSPVYVYPTSDLVHIKATTINGVVHVEIPSDSYEGRFALTTVWARSSIKAPNASDIHIEKLRPNLKAGYYKADTENKIYISATHGLANLTFY